MLNFVMNASNFGDYLGGGSLSGTRLMAGGVELDLTEFPADGQTLGLWHLHDQVLTDAGGHGYDLQQGGAQPAALTALGAAFEGTHDDALRTAADVDWPATTPFTVELWSHGLSTLPAESEQQYFLRFRLNGFNYAYLSLYRDGGDFFLIGVVRASNYGASVFVPVAASAMLAPAHLALVSDGSGAALWLNGQELGVTAFSSPPRYFSVSSFCQLVIGAETAAGDYGIHGLLDEVRLSTAVRYTEAFEPKRYLPTGTFISPAFDAGRRQARWLSLTESSQVPAGAGLVMAVRSGDTLEAGGQVPGSWQPRGPALPAGRYLQWQATLSRAADVTGSATPTLQSVAAIASEAGYNLYHGLGASAAAIDYAVPQARSGPGQLAQTMGGLAYPAVHWFGVRSVNAWGLESLTVDAEVRLELDAAGQAVPPRPCGVTALAAEAVAGGAVQLSWLAAPEMGEAAPAQFRVYSNAGGGPVNFTLPLGSVAGVPAGRHYQWTSAAQTPGATVRFAVRAESAAGGTDAAPAEVEITIDESAPAAAGHLSGSTVLAD